MTLVPVLESLAVATWGRLALGWRWDCAQGEETITDINLLDLKRLGSTSLLVVKTSKKDEANQGTDWEWWIEASDGGWCRFAVQAKRLSKWDWYDTLRKKVGKQHQIHILERYARANRAIPVYCFYNYVSTATVAHWHCSLPFRREYLGCTLAPLDVAKKAFAVRASKSFDAIHSTKTVIPWHCLFSGGHLSCKDGRSHPLGSVGFEGLGWYPSAPTEVANSGDDTELRYTDEFYSREVGYPRWVVVVPRQAILG